MVSDRTSRSLLSLPVELTIKVCESLHDIEDFNSFTSTCRTLHALQDAVRATSLFQLAVASSRVFFRPSPHFLVAAVARTLGDWARSSTSNASRLKSILSGGIDALLNLCLDTTTGCDLTMQRIRHLHALRFSTLNPVTDLIDKCIGTQWYSTPNFWDGGVSNAYTIHSDPDEAVFHLAIYGELFVGDFDAILDGRDSVTGKWKRAMLGEETRLEYIKYCLPDWACSACQGSARDVRLDDGSIDPRRAVQTDHGPYASDVQLRHTHQLSLEWLVTSRRFNRQWVAALGKAGLESLNHRGWSFFRRENNDEYWGGAVGQITELDWKQELWESAVFCQGLEGLEFLASAKSRWTGPDRIKEVKTEDGKEKIEVIEVLRSDTEVETPNHEFVAKLTDLRERILNLNERPEVVKVGRQETWTCPNLLGDLCIGTSGYRCGS